MADIIKRYFNLSLVAGEMYPLTINANQYDKGEQWIFTLWINRTQYTPESGAIVGLKNDGNIILRAGVVDSAGRVVITETEQMTSTQGENLFEILIDGESHGSANFTVLVEPSPGNNAELSGSDLSLIQQAIDAAAQIGDTTALQAQVNEIAAEVEAIPEYTLEYFEDSGHMVTMLKAGEENKGNIQVLTQPIKNSTAPITSGGVFNAVNLPEVINTEGQSISIFLDPDKYYIYGELYDLQILIRDRTDDGNIHRYYVMFTSGSTPTEVTLPTGCKAPTGFEINANKTYEIEIIKANGQLFAKYTEW